MYNLSLLFFLWNDLCKFRQWSRKSLLHWIVFTFRQLWIWVVYKYYTCNKPHQKKSRYDYTCVFMCFKKQKYNFFHIPDDFIKLSGIKLYIQAKLYSYSVQGSAGQEIYGGIWCLSASSYYPKASKLNDLGRSSGLLPHWCLLIRNGQWLLSISGFVGTYSSGVCPGFSPGSLFILPCENRFGHQYLRQM